MAPTVAVKAVKLVVSFSCLLPSVGHLVKKLALNLYGMNMFLSHHSSSFFVLPTLAHVRLASRGYGGLGRW